MATIISVACPEGCTPITAAPGLKSCFLACLESFLVDSKKPTTQQEMIARGKAEKLCGDTGVVERNEMQRFCELFDITFELVAFDKILTNVSPPEAILIGLWRYEGDPTKNHCVRFCRRLDEHKFLVMNPLLSGGRCEEWPNTVIADWSGETFELRLS